MLDTLKNRRHPPHHSLIDLDNRSNILLLTVCTNDRRPILCTPQVMGLLSEAWNPRESWAAGRYVILPDHVHVFCSPVMSGTLSLERWVARWKSFVSRNWRVCGERPLWQRSFWDRQIRTIASRRSWGFGGGVACSSRSAGVASNAPSNNCVAAPASLEGSCLQLPAKGPFLLYFCLLTSYF
jgi:putative transposase